MTLRTLALLALGLTATACAPKTFTVNMGDQPAKEAHYVIVQATMGGTMKIYDCRSMPDGRNWEPTCVKVDQRSSPPD